MKITNISWDTDGEYIKGLPEEIDIPDMPEDDVADYLSDKYGYCVHGFSADKQNEDLGTWDTDVQLQPNGKFDVWISHAGSSGTHYRDVDTDMIGRLLAEDIECIAEQYAKESGGESR